MKPLYPDTPERQQAALRRDVEMLKRRQQVSNACAVATARLESGNAFTIASGVEVRMPFYTVTTSDAGAISWSSTGSAPPYNTVNLNSDAGHNGVYYLMAGVSLSSEASVFALWIQGIDDLHAGWLFSGNDFTTGPHPGTQLMDHGIKRLAGGAAGSAFVRLQNTGSNLRVVDDATLSVIYIPTAEDV